MSLEAGRGKLYTALKILRQRWDEVLAVWNDPVRQDFEEHTQVPLDVQTATALHAIDRLRQILAQARQECRGNADPLAGDAE